jgi:hypothetical protein
MDSFFTQEITSQVSKWALPSHDSVAENPRFLCSLQAASRACMVAAPASASGGGSGEANERFFGPHRRAAHKVAY